MYHLLRGLHEYLTRKDEFSIVIIGLDNAGKTVKTLYNDVPGMAPDKIGPTVGQNSGQASIRSIWEKYYDECHAVVFVLDSADQARLSEAWEVFDSVITSPRLLNLPLLLIANKQDTPTALAVNEVRESFEAFQRAALAAAAGDGPSSARTTDGEAGRERQSMALDVAGEGRDELAKMERMATLDVLGMSALTGDGVKNAVEWLYSRVQNARRM
ncbi:hypothetical protein QFC21_001058 [Naganishia friedmannii]|uniref:Uncharacterized protein n=1 Tax=Naganishia friedmannii TaxID=89922 RepID=A0ACC2W8S2_9TREE|nr:hypothetical protein QFC21_001058 [Naganishia friedmannii]